MIPSRMLLGTFAMAFGDGILNRAKEPVSGELTRNLTYTLLYCRARPRSLVTSTRTVVLTRCEASYRYDFYSVSQHNRIFFIWGAERPRNFLEGWARATVNEVQVFHSVTLVLPVQRRGLDCTSYEYALIILTVFHRVFVLYY